MVWPTLGSRTAKEQEQEPFTRLITHAHYFGNVYCDNTTFSFCFSDELDVFVRLVLYGIVLL